MPYGQGLIAQGGEAQGQGASPRDQGPGRDPGQRWQDTAPRTMANGGTDQGPWRGGPRSGDRCFRFCEEGRLGGSRLSQNPVPAIQDPSPGAQFLERLEPRFLVE